MGARWRGRLSALLVRRAWVLAAGMVAFVFTVAMTAWPARADFLDELHRPDYGAFQTWTGTDIHSNGWLVYGGTTVAPLTDVFSDGLRLRATTGYGGYGWQGRARMDENDPNSPYPKGNATTNYVDFLAGYYKQLGQATIKVFAGFASIEHNLGDVPVNIKEADLPLSGWDYGPKASFEIWYNVSADIYASFDFSYTTAHGTYSSHARAGYRFLPTLSAGVEAAVNGNAKNEDYRGGLFVRYERSNSELRLSGGITSNDLGNISDESFYGTANLATRY